MISLVNKNILITGASSGIGRQIAITASEIGATLTIVGRNEQNLKETISKLKGNQHQYKIIDVTDENQLNSLLEERQKYDGVVFNAGIVEYLPVKFLKSEKIKHIFSTNFEANVLLTQKLLKNKQINNNGSLVYISSISSKLGIQGTAMYSSSKAALVSFSKIVATETASQGIRSNAICPGIIVTPMTEIATEIISNEELKNAATDYPLGYGKPSDVAGLVMYLLSDISRWMTGTDIIIDGGLTLK